MPIPFQKGGSPRVPFHFQKIVHTTENPKNPPFEIGRKSRGSTRWYCFKEDLFAIKRKLRFGVERKSRCAPWSWKAYKWIPLELKGSPKGPPWNLKAIHRASPLKLKRMEALRNSIQFQNGVPFNFKIGILSIWDLLFGTPSGFPFKLNEGSPLDFCSI